MGLFLKQDENRSKLSSHVTANLNHRLTQKSLTNTDAEDAVLLKNQRTTTGGGLFWTIIAIVVIVAVLVYLLFIY